MAGNVNDNFQKMKRGLNNAGVLNKEKTTQSGFSYSTYEDIMKIVKNEIGNQLIQDKNIENEFKETKIKDKKYLRDKIKNTEENIRVIIQSQKLAERDTTQEELIQSLSQDISGYSILSKAFEDDEITDIFCMKYNNIFVKRNGIDEKYPYSFQNSTDYKNFVERLLRESSGKELNKGENKIIDFDLYGDRYSAIDNSITPNGITLTIRKHNENHIKLEQVIEKNLMTSEFANMLGTLIVGESNLVYSGITGSGKTTTLRALIDFYVTRANKRIIVCEDTKELDLENEHTVSMETVKGSKGSEKDATAITLRDLIVASLRMMPKYIIVGEVRGVEAEAAVEAMSTGHSTMFTMHAGEPIDVVNRLVTKYLQSMPSLGVDVVERIIGSSLDYIGIQDDIPGIGRRCTSLTEVIFDYEKNRVKLIPIVKFNFKTKNFDFINPPSETRIEKLLRKGITYEQIEKNILSLFETNKENNINDNEIEEDFNE